MIQQDRFYDIPGNEVDRLVDGLLQAGKHEIYWNISNSSKEITSGIYYHRKRSRTEIAESVKHHNVLIVSRFIHFIIKQVFGKDLLSFI